MKNSMMNVSNGQNSLGISTNINTRVNNSNPHPQKMNTFNKSNLIDRLNNNHPQTTKFKSLFDKEGNPFKYFMDIKKHLNSNSNSLTKYTIYI